MSAQTTIPTPSNKRTASITGLARGIGKAIALRLAHDGYDICVNDIEAHTTDLETVVTKIQNTGRKAYGHIADVTSVDAVNTLVAQSVHHLGPLNVMIANAGIAQVKALLDLTEHDIRTTFDVNFFGVYNCYAAAARQFIEQGGGGKILGAASIVAFKPFPSYRIIQRPNKWAVRGLTQAIAMEMAPHDITVNAYAPWHRRHRDVGTDRFGDGEDERGG
ncbi:MAG: hypothetical protein Q9199_000587 [Rusavskia elegans]